MIATHELTKIYGREDSAKVYALNGVSIQIEEGEAVCIMGKSGSGKSTLLHMLGGLDTPTSGTVRYQELCLTDMPEKKLSQFRQGTHWFCFSGVQSDPRAQRSGKHPVPCDAAQKAGAEGILGAIGGGACVR